jgi:exonuclease SbcD
VSGAEDPQEVTSIISEEIEEHVRSELDTRSLELSLVRVSLTGRTDAHSALVDQHRSMERGLGFQEGTVSIRIESIEVDTRPAIDLEDLAEGDNAAAYLADFLLEIENFDPTRTTGT